MSRLLPEGSQQQQQHASVRAWLTFLSYVRPAAHRALRYECAALLHMGVPLALANLLERSSMVKVAWLAAAPAANHRSRGPPAGSRLPSGPERRALAARSNLWVTAAVIGQHGGAAELGPASLASTVNSIFGDSVNIGLSLAVQTLASQAAGAGDAVALRKSLQRAFPIGLVFSVPVMALLLSLGPLLRLLGRPDAFAATAAAYGRCILPVAFCMGSQRAMTAWLAALRITHPVLIINLLLVPVHALLTWFLVLHSPLGYLGAGVAMSLQQLLRVGATYTYIRTSPRCAHAWDGFRLREALSGWADYLRLALPGVLLMAEFLVGEFLVFAAALLPHPAATLSALAIYQLTNVTSYQPPGGMRVAVGARVGNALGAGEVGAARVAWVAGLVVVSAWIAVPVTLLSLFTRPWALIFTDDEEVVALLGRLAPWLMLYVSLDALLAIHTGALTGAGRQQVGGRLSLLSYVALGLPMALLLGFGTDLGAVGIIAGHTLGKLVMTALSGVAVGRTDWRGEAETAQRRRKEAHAAAAATELE